MTELLVSDVLWSGRGLLWGIITAFYQRTKENQEDLRL